MSTRTETTDNLRAAFSTFGSTLAALRPDQWETSSLCPDWTVRDVAIHVAAIETALSGWAPGDEAPFPRIPAAMTDLSELSTTALADRFVELGNERIAEIESMTDDAFSGPSFTPVGQATYHRFMSIRVFDVWVHERDIRIPLGMSGHDGGSVAEMALDEVHRSIGFIVGKKIAMPDRTSIAIELTGPVTRTLFAAVDGRAARVEHLDTPTVRLITDSLTFMLLACGRIDPQAPIDDGRMTWAGDAELAERAARNLAFTM
jgi:uncharacterized protein (TIGR03083 family)